MLGMPFGACSPQFTTTDTSLSGCKGKHVSGTWSEAETKLYINLLEMRAIHNASDEMAVSPGGELAGHNRLSLPILSLPKFNCPPPFGGCKEAC